MKRFFRHLPLYYVRPWFPPWWCTPTGGYSLKTILSHHHLKNKRHNRDHFSLSSLQEANPRNVKTFRLHYFYLFIMSVTYLYEIGTHSFLHVTWRHLQVARFSWFGNKSNISCRLSSLFRYIDYFNYAPKFAYVSFFHLGLVPSDIDTPQI